MPRSGASAFFLAFRRYTIAERPRCCSLSPSQSRLRYSTSPGAASTKPSNEKASTTSTVTAPRPTQHTTNLNLSNPDLSTHIRHLMRRVNHPVAVMTACQPSSPQQSQPLPPDARGMTISSLCTLTLSPPTITFNARTSSGTLTAIRASRTFIAHMIAANDEGARIASIFAAVRSGGIEGHEKAFRDVVAQGQPKNRTAVYIARAGAAGSEGSSTMPLITGRGILKALRCEIIHGKEIEVGDHVAVVARVLGIVKGEGMGAQDSEWGLGYADGKYRTVGLEIDKASEGQEDVVRTQGLGVRRGDER